MSLSALTIAAARDGLAAGDHTAVELTQACLAAIDGAGALNAFVMKRQKLPWHRRGPPMQGAGRVPRR